MGTIDERGEKSRAGRGAAYAAKAKATAGRRPAIEGQKQ
jgi:hypothetical protein